MLLSRSPPINYVIRRVSGVKMMKNVLVKGSVQTLLGKLTAFLQIPYSWIKGRGRQEVKEGRKERERGERRRE